MFTLDQIDRLTGGKTGPHDIACPVCGPERRSPANQRRHVLRIWRVSPSFATFRCARCDLHGYARDRDGSEPDAAELARHAPKPDDSVRQPRTKDGARRAGYGKGGALLAALLPSVTYARLATIAGRFRRR
jgi:hypothetical protein